ncbi:MAG: hypothetical protein JO149_00255 [Gammaproteobacteria bacterium]|nr:hypothetical protein [Gammaproteobacteria bacterium]
MRMIKRLVDFYIRATKKTSGHDANLLANVVLLGEGIHLRQIKEMIRHTAEYNIIDIISSLHQVKKNLEKKELILFAVFSEKIKRKLSLKQ